MLGASVPKAPVDEDSKAINRKSEIRTSEERIVSSPTVDRSFAKQLNKSQLG